MMATGWKNPFGTFLVLIAIATAVVIISGMRLSKYEYLEKEQISLQYGVREMVEKRKDAFENTFHRSIAVGVFLCILGIVPLMLAAAMDAEEMAYIVCVDILLLMIACGVFFFVRSGNIQSSFEKLLQQGEYTKEKKEIKQKTDFFAGTYWCVIVAVYLGINFYFEDQLWHKSWIIWPVAGVLFAALQNIINAVLAARRHS